MFHRKFSADRLFDGHRFIEGKVLITDEKGRILDMANQEEAGDDVEFLRGTLTPGLVNCHAHLELSHMRGKIPEQTGLVEFVISVVNNRHIPEEQILASIERAEDEMWSNGIVAVGDICNNLLTIPQKSRHNLHYHNFIEASGFPPFLAPERFKRSIELYEAYKKISPSSIVPHATYSVSDELFSLMINFPGNELLCIHNQETKSEDDWFLNGTGRMQDLYLKLKIDTAHYKSPGLSSIRHFLSKLKTGQRAVLVHNVYTSKADISYANSSGIEIFWCFCPGANLYISGELPHVNEFVDQDCRIVLGTDSLASNHQLDLLSEIREIRKKYPDLSDATVLTWATSNGASALMMDKELGSFEPGKKPGLVVIDEKFRKAQRIL
jgi:aminodeoxyfutalosine deaminase